jgi:SulP family sulfate permease
MVLAAVLFMMRMARLSQSSFVTGLLHEGTGDARAAIRIPRGIEVFEVHGALFFGAVSQFNDALRTVEKKPKVMILLVRDVLAIDASGLHAIVELLRQCRRDRTALVLAGVHAQPLAALEKAGLTEAIGRDNVVGDLAEAVARGEALLAH